MQRFSSENSPNSQLFFSQFYWFVKAGFFCMQQCGRTTFELTQTKVCSKSPVCCDKRGFRILSIDFLAQTLQFHSEAWKPSFDSNDYPTNQCTLVFSARTNTILIWSDEIAQNNDSNFGNLLPNQRVDFNPKCNSAGDQARRALQVELALNDHGIYF